MSSLSRREIWMSGFALFSLFFGAGNLILPPYLGVFGGADWMWVVTGFAITAVVIPILAVLAHAKVQGTLFDLGKKVSPGFSALYCALIYLIAIALPAPRTASVTHEISIQPFLDSSPWITSSVYFLLTFIFVVNRSKIISVIGKFLTPIIVIILLAIIVVAILSGARPPMESQLDTPFVNGILEGYQTFDAIGGVVVGAVIIISLNLRGYRSYREKRELITKSGWIAGGGLLLMYGGLIYSGYLMSDQFSKEATRTEILTGLSNLTLGSLGTSFLAVLVALACFTTCVGVVTGAADYVKGMLNNSQPAFILTALFSCGLGVVLGSYSVQFIIDLAIPALMFIYPITIVLILLNVLDNRYASRLVFRAVIVMTFVFSIPDFLQTFISSERLSWVYNYIPWSKNNLGWVLPAVLTFILANLYVARFQNQRIK